MTKILFTDIDGTLLTDTKEIPEENRKAIEQMTNAGHKIDLATGRALPGAVSQAEKLSLTYDGCYVIAFNGGEIYDTYRKQTLYKSRIPMDTVDKIFQLCEKEQVHVQTYDNTHVLAYHMNKHLERYCKEIVCEYKLVDDITASLDQEPSKVLLLDYDNHETLERMKELILDVAGNTVDAFYSSPSLLEVVLKGTHKGVAVQKLCEILDIPLENSVAVGDGMNDIPMIKAAHIGVAMKNANDTVKSQADYVTTLTNNEGGFAELVEKFLL